MANTHNPMEISPDEEKDFLGSDYDPNIFKQGTIPPNPLQWATKLMNDPQVKMGIEMLFNSFGKLNRVPDDLHDMRNFLNDIRVCFIALTVSGYVGILLYALIMCLTRRRNGGHAGGPYDGGDPYAQSANAYRQGRQQRSGSRYGNFDLESGGAVPLTGNAPGTTTIGLNEWDDMVAPPPPNGNAIRTPDGYRYRPANMGKSGNILGGGNFTYHQNRLTTAETDMSGPTKAQLIVENHTGGVATVGGQGSGGQSGGFRESVGFIEKSPSIG